MIPAIMPTYGRWDVAVDRGEGCYLYATDGRKFLDFTSGIAVTSLGHCHPHLIEAVTAQAQKLWHTSNLFQIPGQQKLAERLVANSFADTVFFNNSGAEAVELSLKVARKYQSATGHPERYRVIGCHGSFHGRSFATLAAAGAEGYLKGFGPVMDGFDHVAFNNLNEMRAAVTEQTAAILVEPVQGEGGVRAPSSDYLRGLRAICDEFGLLLVYDEVQCGMGRTGKLFAELRGSGLLLGIKCVIPAGDFVAKLRAEGLLCLTAGDNVLRILPPLIVGEAEIAEALAILNKVAKEWPAP